MSGVPAERGATALLVSTAGLFADDGTMFRKNVSSTPEFETEFAAIRMLPLYVPPQTSDGVLLTDGIAYYRDDGALVETRAYVRPLIVHYTDGHVEFIEEEAYGGFPGHGERDAFGAVSLDDGATWKRTNLSKSGDLSSFKIKVGRGWEAYPGDVGRTYAASDGNKVLIVWVSRYAKRRQPELRDERHEKRCCRRILGIAGNRASMPRRTDAAPGHTPCLYMEDYFGVAGSQGSSDLADEGYPLVGELPYAAVWAARGVMLPPGVDGLSRFVWFKAERLSSGRPRRQPTGGVCVKGAGCVVTWQEDPTACGPARARAPARAGAAPSPTTRPTPGTPTSTGTTSAWSADDGTYGTQHRTTPHRGEPRDLGRGQRFGHSQRCGADVDPGAPHRQRDVRHGRPRRRQALLLRRLRRQRDGRFLRQLGHRQHRRARRGRRRRASRCRHVHHRGRPAAARQHRRDASPARPARLLLDGRLRQARPRLLSDRQRLVLRGSTRRTRASATKARTRRRPKTSDPTRSTWARTSGTTPSTCSGPSWFRKGSCSISRRSIRTTGPIPKGS
jgi:hypothetical protein